MLYEFLSRYKNEIIQLCRRKVATDSDFKQTSALLEQGLPILYDELIGVLQRTVDSAGSARIANASPEMMIKEGNAAEHGKESLRLGYTISQVIHSYGAVCQSITELAQAKTFIISAIEFQSLNLSLDCAIAEAVTEFEKVQRVKVSDNEVERLGFLMHELRNSLAAASAAHQMIRKGKVGGASVTSEVLSRSLDRILHLIENAEVEIRFRGNTPLKKTQIHLMEIVNEVYESAITTGNLKKIHFKLNIDPSIRFTADRHLVFSALSNLISNAMKFTAESGCVSVRGKRTGRRISIEVEDECGGLKEGKTEELFEPFVQNELDKTGMGLGLSLSRQAIESNQGTLTARNITGKGCVFKIDLPVGSP